MCNTETRSEDEDENDCDVDEDDGIDENYESLVIDDCEI